MLRYKIKPYNSYFLVIARYFSKTPPVARPPSIFNDVLGPVMRGPSSSHMGAALRIGRMGRNLIDSSNLSHTLVEYDPNGSLVTTHDGQGSDMGLVGGLLGWEADDARVLDYWKELKSAGQTLDIQYVRYGATHPNTYKLTFANADESEQKEMTAISTGGGMIEVVDIEGIPVHMLGDYYETLVFIDNVLEADHIHKWITSKLVCQKEDIACTSANLTKKNQIMVHIQSKKRIQEKIINEIKKKEEVHCIRVLSPVMPVKASPSLRIPYLTCDQMIKFNKSRKLPLWRLAAIYESLRGGITEEEVIHKLTAIVRVMQTAVKIGVKGTHYNDRILPCQSGNFLKEMNRGGLIEGDVINNIILYITAIMEVKSSMGVIVAAPTAGSCGTLPGTILAVAHSLGCTEDEIVKGILAGGLIGVFIQHAATFSAEVGGCMAECGSASGMAAAGVITLADGTLEEALTASSLALQNCFGMVCDPIGNRVEAPCLGKNIMAGTNALTCANMALSKYEHLIPLDEVLNAMNEVAGQIPHELRCTGKGGLATTPTAQRIQADLEKKSSLSCKQKHKGKVVCKISC